MRWVALYEMNQIMSFRQIDEFPSSVPARPTVNVSGTRSGQFCYRVDDSYAKERLNGWFYLVLLPYFLPLAASLFPLIKLSLKLYRRDRTMLESGEKRFT